MYESFSIIIRGCCDEKYRLISQGNKEVGFATDLRLAFGHFGIEAIASLREKCLTLIEKPRSVSFVIGWN